MTTHPLNVIDFVVNQGHGVRGLSTAGLTTIPSTYLQPPHKRFDASKVSTHSSIPVIDVSNWDDNLTRTSICDAAARYGFFQLVNHGIEAEITEDVKSAVHRFFELPTEEKVKFKKDKPAGARLGTSFSPANEKVLEWRDFLSLQYTTNQAAHQTWPPICKDEIINYHNRLKGIIHKIQDVLLKGLNIETGFDESKQTLLMGWTAINLNYYPVCPNPNLTLGVGAHSDASSLTVLLQDDVGGLYVQATEHDAAHAESSSWVHVPPISGALVVNIGDVFEIVSNGRYKSVVHKVVASERENRVSVAVFVKPTVSHVVAPLEGAVEATGGRRVYRDFVYGDYFKEYFSKGTNGKAALDWAKI